MPALYTLATRGNALSNRFREVPIDLAGVASNRQNLSLSATRQKVFVCDSTRATFCGKSSGSSSQCSKRGLNMIGQRLNCKKKRRLHRTPTCGLSNFQRPQTPFLQCPVWNQSSYRHSTHKSRQKGTHPPSAIFVSFEKSPWL
jgi:hypothetical protein